MYRRVLLKISGEMMMGSSTFGIDMEAASKVATQLAELVKKGHQLGVVIGGGNIFRGLQQSSALKLERTSADHMGMLATLFNGLALKEALKLVGVKALLMSALDCPSVAESFHQEKAVRALEEGVIVLFVGGTGHPYFTTDSAAALRACEVHADILVKATRHVDGVYDRDPVVHEGAKKYDTVSYAEVLEKKLGVMDLTSITLCMVNHIPIRVFNFYKGSLLKAASNSVVGTLIS